MRLKSFHAKTLQDAMQQVRDAMGDDAIIVATRDEPNGVRVTAALDDAAARPEPKPIQFAAVTHSDPDVIEQVADVLLRHSVPPSVTELLMSAVVAQNKLDVRSALCEAIRLTFSFQSLEQRSDAKRIMLIGPPGAGKTLTIAKMAARAVMQKQKVVVFSTDTIRAGGIEQLEAFTRLMNITLMTAETPDALADGLSVMGNADWVLIDTAGRNPYDMQDMKELAGLVTAVASAKVESVLVLPAGGDAHESADIADVFSKMGAKRFIPTRIDLSRRLGGLLAAAEKGKLAFADGSNTFSVADGLQPLTADILTDYLLSLKGTRA